MGQIETGRISVHGEKCALKRSVAATAAAALLASSMFAPAAAFAAESLDIDEGHYTEAAKDEANTWNWDGGENLALNNYNGKSISAVGDLTITLEGDNTITGEVKVVENPYYDPDYSRPEEKYQLQNAAVTVKDGDLTIKGSKESSLTVRQEDASDYDEETGFTTVGNPAINNFTNKITETGEMEFQGTLTIDGVKLNVESLIQAIAGNNIRIQNGADIIAKTTYVTPITAQDSIRISDSSLDVSTEKGGYAIWAQGSEFSIENSYVKASTNNDDPDMPALQVSGARSGANVGMASIQLINEKGGTAKSETVQKTSTIGDTYTYDLFLNFVEGNDGKRDSIYLYPADSAPQKDNSATSDTTQPVTTKADAESPKPASNSAVTGNKNNSAANSANNTPAKAATQAAASAPQTPKTADSNNAPFAAVCVFASAALMAVAFRMRKETLGKHVK